MQLLPPSMDWVYTWGNNAKNQLGRIGPAADSNLPPVDIELWYATPAPITGLGNAQGKTVTWIGASADQTILKLDESLINAQNLVGATICSNKHQVLLLPTHNQHHSTASVSQEVMASAGVSLL